MKEHAAWAAAEGAEQKGATTGNGAPCINREYLWAEPPAILFQVYVGERRNS
jgi:hypothetical protein